MWSLATAAKAVLSQLWSRQYRVQISANWNKNLNIIWKRKNGSQTFVLTFPSHSPDPVPGEAGGEWARGKNRNAHTHTFFLKKRKEKKKQRADLETVKLVNTNTPMKMDNWRWCRPEGRCMLKHELWFHKCRTLSLPLRYLHYWQDYMKHFSTSSLFLSHNMGAVLRTETISYMWKLQAIISQMLEE